MRSLKVIRAPINNIFDFKGKVFILVFLHVLVYRSTWNGINSAVKDVGFGGGFGSFVRGMENSKVSDINSYRKKRYKETGMLPRYPVPGLRYGDLESSEEESKAKTKKERGSSGSKKHTKKRKGESKDAEAQTDDMGGGLLPLSGGIGLGSEKKLEKEGRSKERSGYKAEGKRSSRSSSPLLSTDTMSTINTFIPGVNDNIWQDPSERRTYRNLNQYYGKYFPKIATSPYRKTSECSSLFTSAKEAYESREVMIHPSQFVGLALPFARHLGDILGQFVSIQDSCLMLRILLHMYSGMRTRAQLVNIVGAVLQNDVLLGRIEDRSGVLTKVVDLAGYFLQLPKHRADNRSKQMSAIEINSFFHLSVYPKDNSFESKLFPLDRKKGELLKQRIEERTGIVIARDEVMSMVYILLNFLERERTLEQCTEIVEAIIGITHNLPLTSAQKEELEKICIEVLSCSERGSITLKKEDIIDIFGPGSSIVEMRQADIKGPPISGKMRIWREIGTLDYLGRVVSVKFNDCNGLKATHMNRLCSMIELMNKRLIKTGTVQDLLTIEELCGAHRYRNTHPGIKWSIAIKATLQERHRNIPVRVEKLFSHFIKHEKRKLGPLDGGVKQKREVFYAVPEFPEPTYIETVTPRSLATGIPSRDLHKQDLFYAFNTQPAWVQNRFIFAAAFFEETLMRLGQFCHISAVSLYNGFGGVINEDSNLSLVLPQLPGINSEHLKLLTKAFVDYELGFFSLEIDNNSDSPELFNRFIEAFYEYPYAYFVQGRYFVEVNVDFEGVSSSIIPKNQYKFDSPLNFRTFTFQAFINARLNVHGTDNNIMFITTEEAHKILKNCVDGSKLAIVAEMRNNLSLEYFSDSLIDILAGEWTDYEGQILPEVLGLNINAQDSVSGVNMIYSQGFRLAALGLDGWELLVDPRITLSNLVNNVSNSPSYTSSLLSISSVEEARQEYIYQWLQLYFIYSLNRTPQFNKNEIKAILASIPRNSSPTMPEIRGVILNSQNLVMDAVLVDMISLGLESYFFYEKHFLVHRNLDLSHVFSTPNYGLVQGKLLVPNAVWSLLPFSSKTFGPMISTSAINLAELVLAFVHRLSLVTEMSQTLFIELVNWAVSLSIDENNLSYLLRFNCSDFIKYVKGNTWLKNPKSFMLVPWVDHLISGFRFRRTKGLAFGQPGRLEDSDVFKIDQSKVNLRALEIISEVERLNLQYRSLLLELENQIMSDDASKSLLYNIELSINSLLTELKTISTDHLGAALMMITERRLVPSFVSNLTSDELTRIGISVSDTGDIVFDSSKQKVADAVFVPALDLGTLDYSTGVVKLYDKYGGKLISTQAINRSQAFRVWWNSVFPKISFINKDPLILRDLLDVSNLLNIFHTLGYSEDPLLLGNLLWGLTSNHHQRLDKVAFKVVAQTFMKDERNALGFISPPTSTLEEGYRSTRVVSFIQETGGTPPQFAFSGYYYFLPFIPVVRANSLGGRGDDNNDGDVIRDKVNFIDYLERIVAEYYASPPRNMPTIGIPRLDNLAMIFSANLDELVPLISSIFGEGSPYISAPSIGASAFSLANYIINMIPPTDLVDSTYISLNFGDEHLSYGSPPERVKIKSPKEFVEPDVNFSWTTFFSIVKENDLISAGIDRFGELVSVALDYTIKMTKIDFKYTDSDLSIISLDYLFGQHFLESARVDFSGLLKNVDVKQGNRFCAVFSRAISILVTHLEEMPPYPGAISAADSIFSMIVSDSLAGNFFPESVRNEIIRRLVLILSLNMEFTYIRIKSSKDVLDSVLPDVPEIYSSIPSSVSQRQHNQMSNLKIVNSNVYITRTSACNLLFSAGLFIEKVITSSQNSERFNPLISVAISDNFIWNSYCGIPGFEQVPLQQMLIAIFKNLPSSLTLTQSELNDIELVIKLFETKIVEIISSHNGDYNANTPIDVLFSNLDICTAAIENFFQKNSVIVKDLKPENSRHIGLAKPFNHRHFGLIALDEASLCRINRRSILEEVSMSILSKDRISILASGYSQSDQNRQSRPNDQYFLPKVPLNSEIASNFPLETMAKLAEKYSKKISIELPVLTSSCRGKTVCSYLKVSDSDSGDDDQFFVKDSDDKIRYSINGSYLDGRLVESTNRAVFFFNWWLYTWELLPFYSNDFFLGSIFTNMMFLSQVFEQAQLSTDIDEVFKSFYSNIIQKFLGYSRMDHLRLIILGFLDSESKAIDFVGVTNIKDAYSGIGMLNSVSVIYLDFKVPEIPIPKGKLTYNNLDSQSVNNLAQYLFRIISEYFAASPRSYPTVLIPSTIFLASFFTLEKQNLIYLLYIWSNLDSENSIRAFFEAPSIGASFDSLADFILDNASVNFFNDFSDLDEFLSSDNFNGLFKYGNVLWKVVNLELLDFPCIPPQITQGTGSIGSKNAETCRPFAFHLDNQSKENLAILAERCFIVSARFCGIPSDSIISTKFSLEQVVAALFKGVDVLDAVRVHGIPQIYAHEINYLLYNKFSLTFSNCFSRILAVFTDTYFLPRLGLSLDLSLNDLKLLSGRSLNTLLNVVSVLDNLRVLSKERFSQFVSNFGVNFLHSSISYEPFFGLTVVDQARGLLNVPYIIQSKVGTPIYIHVPIFNYVYSFILFFLDVLINKNAMRLNLAFSYYNLLSLENVIRVSDYVSRGESLPSSLLRVISLGNRYSVGDLNIKKINSLHGLFVKNVRERLGEQTYVAFSSRSNLGEFLTSLFHISKNVDFSDSSRFEQEHQDSDPIDSVKYSIISPKSQSTSYSKFENDILNNNNLRDQLLELHDEYSGVITGTLGKPWVLRFPTIVTDDELVSIPKDSLFHLDQGNVYLQKQLKEIYTLRINTYTEGVSNSVIDLRGGTISSGVIQNSKFSEINGLEVGILNRSIFFREWFIRFWGLNKSYYRDPVILGFLNSFDTFLFIFKKIRYDGADSLSTSLYSSVYSETRLTGELHFREIATNFCEFENESIMRTGYSSIIDFHKSGVSVTLFGNVRIYGKESLRNCEIKKEVWPTSPFDSQTKKNLLDYVTYKLVEYFSVKPRSALSFTIPDVTILLDNFTPLASFRCVVEVWARDRLDLISAPFIGLDPASIHDFLIEIFKRIESLDDGIFKRTRFSFGFLEEPVLMDVPVSFDNVDISLRQYDSLYIDMIASILENKKLKHALDSLLSLAILVLDNNDVNVHKLRSNITSHQGHTLSTSLNVIGAMLDVKTFLIRVLLGIDGGFAAKMLFLPVYHLTERKLNKAASEFTRKFNALKECSMNDLSDPEFDDIASKVTLSLRKMGVNLTSGEILSLSSIYLLVYKLLVSDSAEDFVIECLNMHSFHIRPSVFETIPEIGLVSQLDGNLIDSFNGFFLNPIGRNYLIDINGILFLLFSLNIIINQNINKEILNIPASINFVTPGILTRISHYDFSVKGDSGSLVPVSEAILNSLLELNVDVGDLTSEVLAQILGKIISSLGTLSNASYPKYESPIKSLDLNKNANSLIDSPTDFNPSYLNQILGDYNNMRSLVFSTFGLSSTIVCDLSDSLASKCSGFKYLLERMKRPNFNYSPLYSLEGYNRGIPFKNKVISFSGFLSQSGFHMSPDAVIVPLLADIGSVGGKYFVFKGDNSHRIPIQVANRSAFFYIFAMTSTWAYEKLNELTLLDCIKFFEHFSHVDILDSIPHITSYFPKVSFYKMLQLLDAFYTVERIIFSVSSDMAPFHEYSKPRQLLALFDQLGPVPLDVSIPQETQENTFSYGKFICQLARKFLTEALKFGFTRILSKELSMDTCEKIAKRIWPTTQNSKISSYLKTIVILEFIPTLRATPKYAKELVSTHDWFVFTKISGSFGDVSDVPEVFKAAFSKPMVCIEEELPWLSPNHLFNGVSFCEFNFLSFLKTAWKQFCELHKIANASPPTEAQLVEVLESYKKGLPLVHSGVFSRLLAEARSKNRSPDYDRATNPNLQLTDADSALLRESFFGNLQKFWRIRHSGSICVSFRWPAIDCDVNNKQFIPGLSFPLVVNPKEGNNVVELEVTSLGELFEPN